MSENLSRHRLESRDIYETEDLPEVDQNVDEYHDKSIDIISIQPLAALNRFKGKTVELNKDFSKEKKIKVELLNPILKANRIKQEIEDLKCFVEKLQDASTITDKDPISKEQFLSLIDGLQKQLIELNVEKQLDNCDLGMSHKNTIFKKLQTKIKEIQVKENDLVKKPGKNSEDSNYNLMSCKEVNEKVREVGINNLSKRLTELERVIGIDDGVKLANVVSECPNKGVLDAVERLTAKTGLLHGPQLTVVESRINNVINRLKTLETVSSVGNELDPEAQAKVGELYELVKKWDHIINQLPTIIDNCASMQELHEQCSKMGQSVNQLSLKQKEINAKMDQDKMAINNMEKNLPENIALLDKNIQLVTTRLQKLH